MEKRNILIVNCNETNLALLRLQLESGVKDVNVIEGGDIDAIEKVSEHVKVIISGDRLPSGSGLQALIKLESDTTKCLYATCYEEEIEALNTTGIAFFQIPNPKAVIKFVKEKLKGVC